jgi:hypothetical protein
MLLIGLFNYVKCFTYNITDLSSFESPSTEVWIDRGELREFAAGIARDMLKALPDLTNKGMCVGIYTREGEPISYIPLDTLH